MVAMIELSRGTLLVTSIGCAQLATACNVTTGRAAVALPSVAVTADVENLVAFRSMAESSTEDEFQRGRRPFPKAGLDKATRVMAG